MKVIVAKEEIQEKLANIQNIVEKRSTMPILGHFLLDAGKDGSSIVATDLETALKEPLHAKVEKEGKICIPARKLYEIVREVDGEIVCDSLDDQWLKIKAGRSTFRMACLPAREFPAWPGTEDIEKLTVGRDLLREVLEKTLYAAGESDTRYTLNGLLFHVQPGVRLSVVGTDGHRLSMITKGIEGTIQEERKAIIPRKSAAELRRILDKAGSDVDLTICRNHILFRLGDMEFLTRLIEGTYPNYEQVIPSVCDKKVGIPREALAKTLRRVAIMSKERSNAIRASFSENVLAITSSNPDIGEAHDEIAIDYQGEDLSLGFNARFFLDILDVMSSETIVLEMQTAISPVLLRDEKDPDYRCVIMPMRI